MGRTRSRSGMWDRWLSSASFTFPKTDTMFQYPMNIGTKYYPPWLSLAAYAENKETPYQASSTTYNTIESMTDAGGSVRRLQNKSMDWNPCIHTRQMCGTERYQAVSTVGTSRKVEGGRRAPPAFSSFGSYPALTLYDTLSCYAECYNEMIPDLEGDLSLANFILELKDFKGLVKTFSRGWDAIKNVADDVRHYVEPVKRPVRTRSENQSHWEDRLREWQRERKFYVGDKIADLDLNYHYAIKPFVRDVSIMSTMFGGLDDALRKMHQQGSVRNVHHAMRERNYSMSMTGSGQYRTVFAGRNVYRLTGELTYGLIPMSRTSAFMAWSGLRVNAKKIWDATPFSFVFDHFTNMGECLASFDRSEVYADFSRLMQSITSEKVAVYGCHPTYNTYSHFSGGGAGEASDLFARTGSTVKPISWSVKRSYQRSKLEPPFIRPPVLPRLKFPGADQIRLDLDLGYKIFCRGQNKPAWRRE